MNNAERKKFSVGDVLRKLDQNGDTPESSAQSEKRPSSESIPPSTPKPTPPRAASVTPRQRPAAPPPAALPPVTTMPETEADDEEAFDLFQYLSVIVRRRNTILLVVIAATIYAIYAFFTAPRYYQSHARLLFNPGQQEIVVGDYRSYHQRLDRERAFRTHLELLRSRAVLAMLSANLDHRIMPEAIAEGLTIQRGMTAGEENDIIEISFQHTDAELAKAVANELCRTYIDYGRDVNAQEQTRLILKLQTQIDKLQKNLGIKEDAFRGFKEEQRMVHLSDEASAAVTQVSNMEVALHQTQLELVETKERLKALQSNISRQEISIVQSMTYDNAYQNRLADLELQLSTLAAEYSSEHFKVRMLREQIDTLRHAMESDAQSQVARQTTYIKNPVRQSLLEEMVQLTINKSALETRRAAQEQLVESLSQNLTQLPALEQKYVSLQRETTLLTETLKMLQREFEQAKIRRDSQESDLRIFELAPKPEKLIAELRPISIIVGIFVGLLLGIALAFLLEYLDQTVKDPTDIEKLTESHLLGFVPFVEGERPIIDASTKATSGVVEPFRAVRANLKHAIDQHGLDSLLVCSALKGEGKTTVIANLALAFALDGRRVVVVDCDLRRSQLHRFFDMPKESGLSEYLTGTADLDTVVRESSYKGIHIVTSGNAPHTHAEMLSTPLFANLIEQLRDRFDLVLLDTPPLLPVSDVITIAPNVDAAVMVVRTLWTPKKAAKQTAAHLRRIGLRIIGCVANGVSHGRGYYSYYYGYYARHYGYHEDDTHGPWWKPTALGKRLRTRLRERANDLRLQWPGLLTQAGLFIRALIRGPLFWILLAAVVALLIVEQRLGAQRPSDNGGIEHLSQGQSAPPPIDDIAFGHEQQPSATTPPPEELSSCLARWAAAVRTGDIPALLSFYEQEKLEWHAADSSRTGRSALRYVMSLLGTEGIVVDSVGLISVASPSGTTFASLRFPQKKVGSMRLSMSWHQENGAWRLVAHTAEDREGQ